MQEKEISLDSMMFVGIISMSSIIIVTWGSDTIENWVKKFLKPVPANNNVVKIVKKLLHKILIEKLLIRIIPAVLIFSFGVFCYMSIKTLNHISELKFPCQIGTFIDTSNVFFEEDRKNIEHTIKTNEKRFAGEFAFVTIPYLPLVGSLVSQGMGQHEVYVDIDTYAYQLSKFWKWKSKDMDDSVILLWVTKTCDVHIEVGDDLKNILTEKVCNEIVQSIILPHFEKGDYYQGVHNGILAIYDAIEIYDGKTKVLVDRFNLVAILKAVLFTLLAGMCMGIIFCGIFSVITRSSFKNNFVGFFKQKPRDDRDKFFGKNKLNKKK